MGIGRREDERLSSTGSRRIDVVCKFLGNHAIELRGYHALVKLLDLKADFIWGVS